MGGGAGHQQRGEKADFFHENLLKRPGELPPILGPANDGLCDAGHGERPAAARGAADRVIQITFANAFPEFSSRNTFGRGF
jgi:hypothetical protein